MMMEVCAKRFEELSCEELYEIIKVRIACIKIWMTKTRARIMFISRKMERSKHICACWIQE